MAILWLQEEEVHENLPEDQEKDLLDDQNEDPQVKALVVKLLDVHELSLINEKAN
jgi:hypothetical protein